MKHKEPQDSILSAHMKKTSC